MFSNVTYAFHGEALHGHRHHSSETLLEKTRTALQLQAPPRRRRIGLLHLPHGPNTNPNVQRKRGNKTITRFSVSVSFWVNEYYYYYYYYYVVVSGPGLQGVHRSSLWAFMAQ